MRGRSVVARLASAGTPAWAGTMLALLLATPALAQTPAEPTPPANPPLNLSADNVSGSRGP